MNLFKKFFEPKRTSAELGERLKLVLQKGESLDPQIAALDAEVSELRTAQTLEEKVDAKAIAAKSAELADLKADRVAVNAAAQVMLDAIVEACVRELPERRKENGEKRAALEARQHKEMQVACLAVVGAARALARCGANALFTETENMVNGLMYRMEQGPFRDTLTEALKKALKAEIPPAPMAEIEERRQLLNEFSELGNHGFSYLTGRALDSVSVNGAIKDRALKVAQRKAADMSGAQSVKERAERAAIPPSLVGFMAVAAGDRPLRRFSIKELEQAQHEAKCAGNGSFVCELLQRDGEPPQRGKIVFRCAPISAEAMAGIDGPQATPARPGLVESAKLESEFKPLNLDQA